MALQKTRWIDGWYQGEKLIQITEALPENRKFGVWDSSMVCHHKTTETLAEAIELANKLNKAEPRFKRFYHVPQQSVHGYGNGLFGSY